MQQTIQRFGGPSSFKGLYQLLLFGIQVVELKHSILDLGRQKTAFRVVVLRPPELVAQTLLAFLLLLRIPHSFLILFRGLVLFI